MLCILYFMFVYVFLFIFTFPLLPTFPIAFFVFQIRKTNRFACLSAWQLLRVRTSYGIVKILPANGCLFFSPWVSWVVFQLIRLNLSVWLRRLEQSLYNVVIKFLMLKQRYNRLIVANCGKKIVAFLLSSFGDFDRLLLSEIILVRALMTRL